MSISKERKEKLVAQYCEGITIKITEYQEKFFRQKYGKYIMVERDDNSNHICTCSACGTEFKADGKTKHNSTMACPHCGKEMKVIHKWRKTFTDSVDWAVIPKAIDENTIMFRYILIYNANGDVFVGEEARKVVHFNGKKTCTYPFEKSPYDGKWYYSKRWYFTEYYMYHPVKLFCDNADEYKRMWFRELNKLAMFQYVNAKEFYNYHWTPWYNITHLHSRMDLYEKLYRIGLAGLAREDMDVIGKSYDGKPGIQYDNSKSSLIGMLDITKDKLKLLKQKPTVENVKLLQAIESVDNELFDLFHESKANIADLKNIKEIGVSQKKVLRYAIRHGCKVSEWIHYRRVLAELGYNLTDESYLFPKDFRKADARVTEEKAELEIRKSAELKVKQSSMMLKIANGLRENKELMQMFAGCEGLQVYVPESAEDLMREGRALHNCIGTYVDRYAEGKTLLFFIRRIDEPDKPFVAMEYCHGKVVQCRYDYNKPVEGDSKIINLAERIATSLRKQNILAA